MEQKIELTSKQSELVQKLNELLKEMQSEGITVVYDRAQYSFAAINGKYVSKLQDAEECDKDAVNIENDVHWGNISSAYLHDYDSYYGDLYAVFQQL